MLPGQSHADPSSFYTSVYSQAQRPDSHTLYTLFPVFECLLFTILHTAKLGLLGSSAIAEKAGLLKGGGAGVVWVSVGSGMDGERELLEINVEMEQWRAENERAQ